MDYCFEFHGLSWSCDDELCVSNVARQSDPIQQPDEVPDEIELPPVAAGLRETGPCVMVVVPRPAHRGRREYSDVAALVADVELAVTDRVAERVHRPGRMVECEDPGEPPQRIPPTKPCTDCVSKTADDSRNDDAEPVPGRSSGR